MAIDIQKMPHESSRNYGTQYLWAPLPGVSCSEFFVYTKIDGKFPTVDGAIRYKEKVGKRKDVSNPRLMEQFPPIQKAYKVESWPKTGSCLWNTRVVSVSIDDREVTLRNGDGAAETVVEYSKLISTIPLPSLFYTLKEPATKETVFHSRPIWVVRESRSVPSESMHVNYVSDPDDEIYRTCAWGNYFQTESLFPPPLELPSNSEVRQLVPGKIWPSPESRDYLQFLRDNEIYTVGRYGSWSPEELLHQTVKRISSIPGARTDLRVEVMK
jgi:hypothetical protein